MDEYSGFVYVIYIFGRYTETHNAMLQQIIGELDDRLCSSANPDLRSDKTAGEPANDKMSGKSTVVVGRFIRCLRNRVNSLYSCRCLDTRNINRLSTARC